MLPFIIIWILPSILSYLLSLRLVKRESAHSAGYLFLLYYAALFYGILAVVETLRGHGSSTLFAVLGSVSGKYMAAYLVPLAAAAVVFPFLSHVVFRKASESRFVSLFTSCLCFLLLLGYIRVNTISNLYYSFSFVLSMMASLFGTFLCKKGELEGCNKANIKQRLRFAVPPTAFYIATVVISFPGTLVLNNLTETNIPFRVLLGAWLAGCLLNLLIIAGAGVLMMARGFFELFYTLLFSFVLTGYLQALFLNGRMLQMDGSIQKWPMSQVCINALIWFAIAALIQLFRAVKPKITAKLYPALCIYLSLIQIVSAGYLFIRTSTDPSKQSAHYMLSTDGEFELHPENNVIVFVLDWYDQQILAKILQDDPAFLSGLDGFTAYTNASSLYAFTDTSVPYLLTATEWQYNMGTDQYIQYAHDNGTVLDDISDADYDMSVYTSSYYVTPQVHAKLRNSILYEPRYNIKETMDLLLKCGKYQTAPFFSKELYWYTSAYFYELAHTDGRAYSCSNDVPFWNALEASGLSIDESTDSNGFFKFYHLYGAHPPFRMSEDMTPIVTPPQTDNAALLAQAKGSFRIVLAYIDQLKKLDLYDRATIVITADHGENYLYDPLREDFLADLELQETSNPILLFKNAGDSWAGVRTSRAPVSHTEMIASIVQAANPSEQAMAHYGQTLADIDETTNRTRTFIFTRVDLPYVKAEITGDILDMSNWSVIERIEAEDR